MSSFGLCLIPLCFPNSSGVEFRALRRLSKQCAAEHQPLEEISGNTGPRAEQSLACPTSYGGRCQRCVSMATQIPVGQHYPEPESHKSQKGWLRVSQIFGHLVHGSKSLWERPGRKCMVHT